ncbi:hypothetical protein BDE02_17G106100 [Populus trichocarpa]|nr:hypothetical protein BDE02_17G106100 [Populus trichocarpa]
MLSQSSFHFLFLVKNQPACKREKAITFTCVLKQQNVDFVHVILLLFEINGVFHPKYYCKLLIKKYY